MPLADELVREVQQLQAQLQSTKRALNVLQGQQRAANQLLAVFDGDLHSFRQRLESIAEEAQDGHFSGTEIFV